MKVRSIKAGQYYYLRWCPGIPAVRVLVTHKSSQSRFINLRCDDWICAENEHGVGQISYDMARECMEEVSNEQA